MTLADFLLARIAEDEQGAHMIHDRRDGIDCACGVPTRIRAECGAKRRIVEAANEVGRHLSHEQDNGYPDDGLNYIWTVAERWDHVLRLLALPYAAHPDYDPSWIPNWTVVV